MTATQSQSAAPGPNETFAFVQTLATELSSGKIDMPSFPDIAARVRKVLSDEFVSSKQVVKVVATEPALAGKLMMIANSVAMNPNGTRITDLNTAITRIGLNMVRSASLAFAMEQIRKSENFASLRAPMTTLWERSVLVASLCYVVAKRLTPLNPDTAMLAGLMHGMGKLYILTRAAKHPALFKDMSVYNQIVRDWHSNIAKAILENWDMNEEIVAAVESFEDLDRDHKGASDLTDVLTVSHLLASLHDVPESIELNIQGVRSCLRIGMTKEVAVNILQESATEVASLRSALGA